MIHEKILEILKKLENKINEIKELNKYWNLNIYELKNDVKVISLLAGKLYKNVNKYY